MKVDLTCNDCGNMRVSHLEITILFCKDTLTYHYTFQCPLCDVRQQKPFNKQQEENEMLRLLQYGCELKDFTLPVLSLRPVDGQDITTHTVADLTHYIRSERFDEDLERMLSES